MGEDKPVLNNVLGESDFEVLFRTYFSSLCFFSMKYVSDLDASKEIVHSVFVKLWERRNDLDAGASLKSYLFTSVHNRSLNYIRDRKKFRVGEVKEEDFKSFESESGQAGIEYDELELKIIKLIKALPEKCRVIFELSRFENMKYKEIADKLNISIKTVEAQMSKALKIMKEGLKGYLMLLLILFSMIWNKGGFY